MTALFPPGKRRIFCVLFHEPDRWWSLPELAGKTRLEPGHLEQQVGCLTKSGIVRAKTIAGNVLLQPEPASPVFSELRSIVAKLAPRQPLGASDETILVVEDQPATARITRILLESWGYSVLEARGSSEAVSIFDKHSHTIRLLLADVMIPEMTGPELADELVRRNPDLRVVFMSGSASDEVNRRGSPFLSKPFNPASLSRVIREELNQPRRSLLERSHGMNKRLD
ncbi:MAG: response regulator [Acidobacteriia bacterium]|nr:response regulator [Terriglobia bacterium]